MRRLIFVITACAVSSIAHAANGDLFDLVCIGQQIVTGKPAIARKERLRFDLVNKR